MVDVDANDRKGVSDSSTSDVELVDSANGRPAYSHQRGAHGLELYAIRSASGSRSDPESSEDEGVSSDVVSWCQGLLRI